MQVSAFVTVVQRRKLTIDESLLPLVAPLFAIETHMSMEERVTLGALAMKLPEHFVACEIGSYLGASTSFLAAAASLKNGVVHCLDTWDNRAMDEEAPRDTYADFLRNTERFARFIVVHRGESTALAAEVPAELDLLFIDGDHSFESVQADLSTFAPRVGRGGLVLVHDWNSEGVQRAMDEYAATHRLAEAVSVHSLRAFKVLD